MRETARYFVRNFVVLLGQTDEAYCAARSERRLSARRPKNGCRMAGVHRPDGNGV